MSTRTEEGVSERSTSAPKLVSLTFRMGPLRSRLLGRGEKPSAIAKRDLQRYYELLEECLAQLDLSEPEAGLLTEAAAGVQRLEEPARSQVHRYLWAEVSDGIREGNLAGRWGVEDPQALVDRIRELAPAEQRALVDALERVWSDRERRRDSGAAAPCRARQRGRSMTLPGRSIPIRVEPATAPATPPRPGPAERPEPPPPPAPAPVPVREPAEVPG